MAFTRDWLETNPIDHTKNKLWPTYDRYVKVDISDRIKTILSGFVSGETLVGIKLGKFLTVGTGVPTAPLGTGTAADVNVYARQTTVDGYADLYIRNTTGPEFRLTILDKLCLDNARLSNDTWFVGSDSAGAAQNIFKVNTANAVEFASIPILPASDPTTDNQASRKKYVDDSSTTTPTANKAVKMDANAKLPLAALKTYDSGWFAVVNNTNYTKTHNLGTIKFIIQVFFSTAADGANAEIVYCSAKTNPDGNDVEYSAFLHTITTTSIQIRSGHDYVILQLVAGSHTGVTSGYYRIVMLALE